MRARTPAVARVLVRSISPTRMLIDAALLAATGTLAVFVLLLASQVLADAMIFQSGLRYSAVVEGAPPSLTVDAASVRSSADIQAARALPGGSGGAQASDLMHSENLSTWTVDSADRPALASVLEGVTRAGSFQASGVLLDEATASRLGVGVGNTLYLDDLSGDVVAECGVTVTGLVAPFRDPSRILSGGLVVLDEELCPELTGFEDFRTFLTDESSANPAHARSHGEVVWQTFATATEPQISGLLLPVLVIGLAFWLLAAFRASGQLREQLSVPGHILIAIGVSRSSVRLLYLVILGITCTVGAVAAGLIARAALLAAAGFYTQPLHLLIVVLIYSAISMLLTVWATRRFDLIFLTTTGGPHA